MKRALTVLSWALMLGWAATIFYLSCQEEPEVPAVGRAFPDWVNHGAVYGLLGLLTFIALQRTRRTAFIPTSAAVVGWCLAFGMGMEYAQRYLTQTRHFDLWDWLADGAGAALACLAMLVLSRAGRMGNRLYTLITEGPQADRGTVLPR